ncbi:MAG TPA: inorganic diphosphatase [Kofleriaceae bacterium]|nr:inorganic diphosphatase [Kofleriaceae bacterium]
MTRDPFSERSGTFGANRHVNVVIETPAGSAAKYAWDPELRAFRLSRLLPLGTTFPCDFGFVIGTRAGDGDPLDAMVLADVPLIQGAVVECRVLGAFECKTSQPGSTGLTRNDRLIVVPVETIRGAAWQELDQVSRALIHGLGDFLTDYTRREGRTFELVRSHDHSSALALVEAAR